MTRRAINVVWLKRDLRLADHAPLKQACEQDLPILLLYIFEPMLLEDLHYSERHWRFVWQSLMDLNAQLTAYQGQITPVVGEAVTVLQALQAEFEIKQLYSHQEVGLANTFERDKQVQQWCANNAVAWHETQYAGVIRAASNREQWDQHWQQVMRQPQQHPNLSIATFIKQTKLVEMQPKPVWCEIDTAFQLGGERRAWQVVEDFFAERGQDYHRHISSPLLSQQSCTRWSAHLAWGNLSIRQVYQRILQDWQRPGWRRPLSALASRLHWHCHFIQKFESECEMQHRPVNQGYENFPWRGDEKAHADYLAWEQGRTGFPLVDASMRCLQQTGYINFRMRAMLVSFLCHQLLLDWRAGVAHLARLFLDFEPGIHYPQFQMQAGVTGTNTLRIYNPTKQAQEQDPDGLFIRKWVPELTNCPQACLHTPWQLLPMEAMMHDFELGRDYPQPIIDIEQTVKQHRELLWSWRKKAYVKQENARILQRHVRLKKQTPSS